MEDVIRLIDRQGWGWNVGRSRTCTEFDGSIHPDRGVCYTASGGDARSALALAYAKAMQAQLVALGIKPAVAA